MYAVPVPVLKMNLQKVTHRSILRFKSNIISLLTMINHIDWILSQSICADFLYSLSVARTVPWSGVGGYHFGDGAPAQTHAGLC
eukprot:SAG31_NODE_12931_length_905_cov_3.574442_1_plen_83_part_10